MSDGYWHILDVAAKGLIGGLTLAALYGIYVLLRRGMNRVVDSVTSLFGKGPRAKKPPAIDR